MRRSRSSVALGAIGALLLILSACTAEPEIAAEQPDLLQATGLQGTLGEQAREFIEGEAMAARVGVSSVTGADCDEEPRERQWVRCTATGDDQGLIFAVLAENGRVFVQPTNVVDAEDLVQLEIQAAASLNANNGYRLSSSDVDCGDTTVILDTNGQLPCTVWDAQNGILFNAVATVFDTDRGDFTIVITDEAAEQPEER